jgi:hypothetical protein
MSGLRNDPLLHLISPGSAPLCAENSIRSSAKLDLMKIHGIVRIHVESIT